MSTIQYTLRNIPPAVDQRLRARARKTGKSFNQTAVEALSQAAGVTEDTAENHDLDWFFGSKTLDTKAFDIVTKQAHKIDPELWK